MYTLIEYPFGAVVEAFVLSMDEKRLRVTAAGFSDVLQFTQSGHAWVTEEGQRIEVGFLQCDVSEAAPGFPPALAACAAVPHQTEG
jgi:hypothetical protein